MNEVFVAELLLTYFHDDNHFRLLQVMWITTFVSLIIKLTLCQRNQKIFSEIFISF